MSSTQNADSPPAFRVVVVDDDFRVASLHRSVVEHVSGFEVVAEAHSGTEALQLVRDTTPDLVLLDLYLPDIPGLEVLRRLTGSADDTVDVIVITAARDAASIEEAVRRGALYYLVKPFSSQVLMERLSMYASMKQRIEALAEADQDEVDTIYSMLRTGGSRQLPKGHSPQTLGLIVETLRSAGEALTAEEVAYRTGVSRPTAHRYLSHLARIGRVRLEFRYGSGRPEHLYEWPS